MKKNILIVESPLQLLNAFEAVKFFNLNEYEYLIRLSGEKVNDKQIINLIKILNLDKYKVLKIRSKNKSFCDFFKTFFYCCKCFLIRGKVNRIFIGNYDSTLLSLMVKQFSKSEIILLDDGSKTLSIQNKFIENGKGNNIFTFYDLTPLNGQVVYKNEYSRVFDLLSDEFFINDKKVLFLGSKLSEVGIINESYYLSLIKQISEYYSGNKILYVPHRGERKEKVNKISRMLNIKVLNVDYPIELFGLYNNELPFKVSSFYSTALLTMKEIYKIEADAFVFDYNNSEHKDAIKETYDYYKDKLNMINFSKHD